MARAASAPMAELLALLTNVHRDPKKHRALAPSDFNPYVMKSRRAGRIPVNAGNIGVLKKAFIKKQRPKRKRGDRHHKAPIPARREGKTR